MSVIIYGTRHYGRVDSHDGEYAETRFFHLYFVPLIPIGTVWFTGPGLGHPIRTHAKSVVAGYLRMWGPVAAFASLAAGNGRLGSIIAAAVATALTVLAWTWRNLRGDAARRRSDYNLIAFGTRCEPARATPDLRDVFKRNLDTRWAQREPERTPDEVAQHGARDATEAVLAYGLLRLASIDRGGAGKLDGQAADRILAGTHSAPEASGGPYRAPATAAANDAPPSATLDQLVARTADERAARRQVAAPAPAVVARAQQRRSRWQLVGLIALTPVALSGVLLFRDAVRPVREVGIKELRSVAPPLNRPIRVVCDDVTAAMWQESENDRVTKQVGFCRLGSYMLAVTYGAHDALPADHVITGRLRPINERALWVRDGLSQNAELEAHTLDVYVATDAAFPLGVVIGGLLVAGLTPGLWFLWFRARRRRKAAARVAVAA